MAASPPRNPVAPSSNAHKPSSVVVVKRRNALVPLPLLPPVPKNTIVTSVKIVHNQEPDSPPESPTSDEEEDGARDPAPPKEGENEEIKSPPISPTQANFNFPSMASNKRNRSQRRRSCCTPRSPPPCGSRGNSGAPPPQADVCQSPSQFPPGTPGEVGTPKPPDTNNPPPSNSLSSSSSSSKRKKPRSTIVVTVRLANPPASPAPDIASGTNSNSHPPPPTTGPPILSRQKSRTFTALSLKKSRLMNLHSRDASQSSNNINRNPRNHPPQPPPPLTPPPPIPAKPAWNRPRVSSNLASCKPFTGDDIIDEDVVMENETEDILYVSAGSPPALSSRFLSARTNSILKTRSTSGFRADLNNRPVKGKKGKASKTGSRLAMLRWAILNDSGPEVGMRIKAMGVRLAKDIWEAERCLDDDEEEVMHLENGSMTMEGSVVHSADLEPDKIMQDAEETTSLQTERERIAEECIRELEDMDVDQEVDQEMAPAEQDEQRVEDKCTSAAVLPNEDSMDIDAPTTPTANTVQQTTINTPKATSPPTTQTPTTTPRIQRRMSFPKRLQVRVDQEVEVLSKTASNTDTGRFPRRRSLADDKIPMMVAAKKWFEKTAL